MKNTLKQVVVMLFVSSFQTIAIAENLYISDASRGMENGRKSLDMVFKGVDYRVDLKWERSSETKIKKGQVDFSTPVEGKVNVQIFKKAESVPIWNETMEFDVESRMFDDGTYGLSPAGGTFLKGNQPWQISIQLINKPVESTSIVNTEVHLVFDAGNTRRQPDDSVGQVFSVSSNAETEVLKPDESGILRARIPIARYTILRP